MKLGHTLRLAFPIGKTIGLAVVLLPVLWGFAEIIARTPWVRANYPYTSMGSPHSFVNDAWSSTDRQAAQRGHIDCIFLGNSMVADGFDPDQFEAMYRQQTQVDLRCAKFAVLGMTAEQSDDYARLLVDIYHPRLLIVGVSARDFSDEDTAYLSTHGFNILGGPWMAYRVGHVFSLEGWLLDSSYAARYFAGLRSRRQMWGQTHAVPPHTQDVDLERPPDPLTEAEAFTLLAHYSVSPKGLAGLEAILALPKHGVQVLVIEMPVHPTYLYFFGRGEQDQELFRDAVRRATQAQAVAFWPTGPDLRLPNAAWADRSHLNPSGSQFFSDWLAGRLAKAAGQGKLAPGLP